ncbi:glutaminase [Nostoc sp. UCD121]|uniref:glutaminase n=1 Tax=unclassified Nostoc TaxID=2593658 RepID=UPI0016275D1B|nr:MULTISPECIES: glutaminase [unclassified Nostoc]MBC1224274.1 glutaminase [Nostoc sp. UCD120]MBC1275949.1 glutaminase [Nostoc sp. UCD121]MBC1293455.1 glutaminase [Nostoc sp. UCD122]MBC1293480.1 glutaminase [Nostoc sp. UCD122]
MKGLEKLTTTELSAWVEQAKIQAKQGRVIDRIPQLVKANPGWFAVHVCCESGKNISFGDTACVFPLMSVIKTFSLLYLLEHFGAETVFGWVGVEPSDAPFNSLEQLVSDRGRPRNPMINSGAITLADKLPGKDATQRTFLFCQWLNQLAGCQLSLDEVMLASVRLTRATANEAIANYLTETGYLENLETALDTYEQICCISGQVEDLALLGKLLACESGLVNPQNRQTVNAVMSSCGLYEASAEFAVRIGLPMKSGIGGGLVAIVPGEGAIACYSPGLDDIGNPVGAIAFVEGLAQDLQLSVFA